MSPRALSDMVGVEQEQEPYVSLHSLYVIQGKSVFMRCKLPMIGSGFGPGGKGSCPRTFFLVNLVVTPIIARRATTKAPCLRSIDSKVQGKREIRSSKMTNQSLSATGEISKDPIHF